LDGDRRGLVGSRQARFVGAPLTTATVSKLLRAPSASFGGLVLRRSETVAHAVSRRGQSPAATRLPTCGEVGAVDDCDPDSAEPASFAELPATGVLRERRMRREPTPQKPWC
jgi:hypothetical protein